MRSIRGSVNVLLIYESKKKTKIETEVALSEKVTVKMNENRKFATE